ncbi:hypothetical protein ACTXLB_14045 [Brachybacterium tyrofermentans]|uniref:hypothetical protein n=1 Tax=Brachybacterium tyrofermentans TaxID=47848 RepID=UPI003FD5F32B
MTSTPMYHPDDETRPVSEDQGEASSAEASSAEHDPDDLVDEGTKRLSKEEAAQHEDAADAQRADAEESGGYGH